MRKYPSQVRKYNFCSNECRIKWLPNIPGRRARVAEANKRRRKERVERLCEWCGKPFYILLSSLGREDKKHANVGTFCSRECRDKWHSNYMKNHPETHAQMRTPEAFAKLSQAQTGKHYSPETNKKKGLPGELNPFSGKHHTRKTREFISKLMSDLMQNPDYRKRVVEAALKGNRRKPNKTELKLGNILDRYFPDEWEYTGDGYHTIGGFAPDFTNCNGKKALIELFGRYWHEEVPHRWSYTELGRIMALNSLGYRCLIIWDYELKGEQAVVAKVKQFMKRRS